MAGTALSFNCFKDIDVLQKDQYSCLYLVNQFVKVIEIVIAQLMKMNAAEIWFGLCQDKVLAVTLA